jgi:type 1 glutamine amidotransferase/nicotinamidase-related amidase
MKSRRLAPLLGVPALVLAAASAGASDAPAAAPPLKVCLVSGSAEYESDRSLEGYAKVLEEGYNATCTLLEAKGFDALPGLEALDACDVALFFTRRLTIDGEALERVKRYCDSGKPIVAVRTASHGFQKWLEFDGLVLGGNYKNHYGAGLLEASIAPESKDHPVLEGVGTIRSRESLYRNTPLAPDATVLMSGKANVTPDVHPVAWTRTHKGGRVFYTSLGCPDDFEHAGFRRLIANALFWTAGRKVERKEPPALREPPRPEGVLTFRLRSRTRPDGPAGKSEEVSLERKVPAAETAIVVCDMWNEHWCAGATKRCGALAAKMDPVLRAAREAGIRIIHCPSETMDFYADSPQRRRMGAAPPVEPPKPLEISDPPLPIDDSDGGCDTPQKPWYRAWTRQHPAIAVGPEDGISDSGTEVYNFLRERGISNLIVMGVHTNMCVLNRSFAIRRMTRLGIRCILVRDLTDAMYDPKDPPRVSHDEGTALVVRHIETYWCPSIASEDLVKGLP